MIVSRGVLIFWYVWASTKSDTVSMKKADSKKNQDRGRGMAHRGEESGRSRLPGSSGNLVEFFAKSPLAKVKIPLKRERDCGRIVKL